MLPESPTGISPLVAGRTDGGWGVNSLGAVFDNENGRHVSYAPGETVQLPGGYGFVVKRRGQEEVEALVIRDPMSAASAELHILFGAADKKGLLQCGSSSFLSEPRYS